MAEGKSNPEIAEALYLSERTVKNYLSNALRKMNFASRTELAVYMVHVANDVKESADGNS